MGAPIYQHDPGTAPDRDFLPGRLGFLVAGNEGRMLDPRRTPIRIVGCNHAEGMFELEVEGFEDSGARWWIPFEDVVAYQFAEGSRTASRAVLAGYEAAVARLDRPLEVRGGVGARAASRRLLARERAAADELLGQAGFDRFDAAGAIGRRGGDGAAGALLESELERRGLLEMDREFVAAFVSNPRAGELVKGHAMALAELGLCPYRGKAVRSATLFDGAWRRERRQEHLLARLGFTQALWARTLQADTAIYRAVSSEGGLASRGRGSFVSATFSPEVALEHFRGGPATRTASLMRQPLPLDRLLMTFLETAGMNARFSEAEAVLIGSRGGLF